MDLYKPIPKLTFIKSQMIVVHPVHEPLIYLNNYFKCDSKYNHWKEIGGKPLPGSSPHIVARKTVADMLLRAESLLPQGYRFQIYDAYRTLAVQQALWNFFRKKNAKEHPDKTDKEINELTALFVSYPSYDVLYPSLHNTGGAVDLTIIDANGNELDMGCDFDDFTDKAWTNYFETIECHNQENQNIRNNRRLLYNVMTAVGFTNLPSEWWHFDYGDEKWAQFTNLSPIYTGILDSNIKDTVSYANMEIKKEINL